MGDIARTGADINFKMNLATWLSLLLGVITLATPALSSEPRVVCYYTNWSVYRPGTARFNPQNINPYLCTHLIYAFGGFTKDNTLKPFDKYQDIEKGGYAKFTGLKTYNKNLKTMLAIGGWNEGSSRFSPMVASRERRKEFVRNAIKFLRQNRFDGLDLDWEYPAFRDGGKPKDRENYARLVKELREEFDREAEKTNKPRLLLTMAVPAGIEYIQKGFDVKTLNTYLDWMNLLTYDYHSAFEPAVNHHAPLYPLEEPNEYSVDTELNIDYTINFYLENGADRDKLVLGIPTYGRSYTLFNADAVEIGSPADGPGEQGDATREKGYLAYYEICEALKPKDKKRSISSNEDSEEYAEEEEEEEEEWTIMHPNPKAMGPVAYKGNQWVGYDDMDIVKKKAEYVAENGLGGIMFWSIDNDDFRGTCHSKPYPLIEAAKEAYIAKLGSSESKFLSATEKPRPAGRPNRRRNKPKASSSSTTLKPSAKGSNKRSSTTPSWNITPEPPTTPDPGADFKCKDEGFFPHPRDCKKYFWCLDSGPSNLGIVAHQFTCPSGLFFNKAADSCDFARNVLCKTPTTTAKPPTKAPKTPKATTASTSTTTRKPIKLSTKNTALFRTTTTSTTPVPEVKEEEEYEEVEETFDEDAEDPKVIKELIDLIKKVGGVEQLEKQLHRAETLTASTDGGRTTPSTFNKKLYQKVLERAKGNKFTGNNVSQNSRSGPQNLGIEPAADKKTQTFVSKDRTLNKDRPQYTTIQRNRPSTTQEPLASQEAESPETPAQSRARAVESEGTGTTPKSLQYVNIRRARPTDAADDTASRNALFERAESYISVSEQPSSIDIASARRENQPEYVTIRRQRPTTEEATTVQYEEADSEVDLRETALEREISSQPQYTSIVRARSTTLSPPEPIETTVPPTKATTSIEESSPEPTTVLSVQISSLLNSPSSAEETAAPVTTVAETTEAEVVTTASSTTRRPAIRRRGSTTTTPAPVSSTTQSARRPFLRRTKPTSTTTAAPTTEEEPQEPTTEDPDDVEADKRDAYEAAKKIKAAEASRKEALASQKEAAAYNKEVAASKKEDEASKLEAEAFVREAAERNATGTTSRPNRRGPNRFKTRKEAIALRKEAAIVRQEAIASRKEAEVARKEVERNETSTEVAEPDIKVRGRRPSLIAGARRTERPAQAQPSRSFARRRSGGSASTTTAAPSNQANRRAFRIASRRRPTATPTTAIPTTSSTTTSSPTTTSTNTPQTTTLVLESEEILQDIGDIDAIEDPTFQQRSAKNPSKVPRRPLINLKEDQNASATNEEERKRQSKKYSSTFKQNQLADILKKSEEVTTEGITVAEDNAKNAIAIATHQLLAAPLPSTEYDSTRDTDYTSPKTEYIKTSGYKDYTTAFRPGPTQDFVQTTAGETFIYDTPRETTVEYTTVDLTSKTKRPYSTTGYETTYDSRGSTDKSDIDTGKVTLDFPTTNSRGSNTPLFGRLSPTTYEAPKLSTLSRYPTTPEYQTVTNQYLPTTSVDFTETDSRPYTTPTLTPRGFSSPNVIISGYTGVQRGGVKYGNDKYTTIPEVPENTAKYTTIPVENSRSTPRFTSEARSTVGYPSSSQEPSGFYTREYLLESPITKTYDDEYQYLSPTTPQPIRKVFRKKLQRRISTTLRPTTSTTIPVRSTTPTYVPEVSTRAPKPRQPSKPFEKVAKSEPNRTRKPVVNYDYYDDSAERVALKYAEGTKVILHGKGSIECLDVGNFPHPSSCKKFISCARMEFGALLGWEYVCSKGLSFDPVGGICNWSAGLGCDEKDD